MPESLDAITLPAGKPLAPRERDTLRRLYAYRQRHGIMPTLAELAELEGVTKVTCWERIGCLVRKGYVAREASKARSLVLLDPGDERERLTRVAAGVIRRAVEKYGLGGGAKATLLKLAEEFERAFGK